MRRIAFVLFLALISSGVLPAMASAETPDVHALLRLRSEVIVSNPDQGTVLRHESLEFVSRGGYTFSFSSATGNIGPPFTSAGAGRGFGNPNLRAVLRAALTRYRIGFQVDCRHTEPNRVGQTEVAWNGRGTRQNRFTVYFGNTGPVNLPTCSPDIDLLLLEISGYIDQAVLADEFFTSN